MTEENDKVVKIVRGPAPSSVSGTKELIGGEVHADAIILPSADERTLKDLFKDLSELDDNANIKSKDQKGLGLVINGKQHGYTNDPYFKEINNNRDDWVYDPLLDSGDPLTIKNVTTKKTGKLKGNTALSKFGSFMGMGRFKSLPLHHSGFWITLNPISEADRVSLEIRLTDSAIELGRTTSGMALTNYSVITDKVISDFIVEHMHTTSLKLEEDDDIRDYISSHDLNIIYNGLISSFYPKGFKNIMSCKNVAIMEGTKSKCDYSITAKINPDKLVFVNRKKLERKHVELLKHRNPNSVDKSEVLEYQKSISPEVIMEITSEDGSETAKIHIGVPTVNQHIEAGYLWVENTIRTIEAALTEGTTESEKNIQINKLSKTTMMNMYLHYVKSVTTDDGTIVDDYLTLEMLIPNLLNTKETRTNFLKHINKAIKLSTVAVIGYPEYTCPKCREKQAKNDEEAPSAFGSIIPINVARSFLTLITLKTETLLREQKDIY